MKEMGVPILTEANNGTGSGAMISPSCISSANQSRSDARTTYFDAAIDRDNLHIATEQTVTLVLLEGSQRSIPIHANTPFHSLMRARGVEVMAPEVSRYPSLTFSQVHSFLFQAHEAKCHLCSRGHLSRRCCPVAHSPTALRGWTGISLEGHEYCRPD